MTRAEQLHCDGLARVVDTRDRDVAVEVVNGCQCIGMLVQVLVHFVPLLGVTDRGHLVVHQQHVDYAFHLRHLYIIVVASTVVAFAVVGKRRDAHIAHVVAMSGGMRFERGGNVSAHADVGRRARIIQDGVHATHAFVSGAVDEERDDAKGSDRAVVVAIVSAQWRRYWMRAKARGRERKG